MFPELATASFLVALTTLMHSVGFAVLLRLVLRSHPVLPSHPLAVTWLLIRVSWALLVIHSAEIGAWAMFYWWSGSLSNLEQAFYFSGVTYTTVGYGDVLLPNQVRLLAPIEALTGILMCGLSAGLFLVLVSRMFLDHPAMTFYERRDKEW